MALYAANGNINVTVVNGSTFVGAYAPDGSLNVVEDTGSTLTGVIHPSGALNVRLTTSDVFSRHHPNGSVYVATNGSKGAMSVNVVSGSLGVTTNATPVGLLLLIATV